MISVPYITPHAELDGTALNLAPGINTIHRVAVSVPVKADCGVKEGAKEEACFLLNAESFWISILKRLRHSRGGKSRGLCLSRAGGFEARYGLADLGPQIKVR